MKLLPSSFSSSSSTISSTTSFDSKSAAASCLAGILRRILCSGTLPTYPSDHVTEETNSVKCFRDLKVGEKILNGSNERNPGLVARLMGLDSMPETNFRSSISRSRSMNSADRLKEEDAKEGLHRRVKSTASFRDTPAFLELENDEFLILNFENVSESREFRSKGGKSEAVFGELKQRRRVKGKRDGKKTAIPTKKEDQEGKRNVLSDLNGKETMRRRNSIDHKLTSTNKVRDTAIRLVPKKIPCQKQHVVGSEAMKSWKPKNSDNAVNSNGMKPSLRTKKKRNNSQVVKPVKPELDSEDSSPVSVLNCDQVLIDPEVPISEDDSSSTTSSSRRKLSLEAEDNCKRLSPRRDDNLIGGDRKAEAKQGKYVGSRKKQSESQENSNVLDEICRLSEAELLGESWVQKWTSDREDFRGIGEELEALILNHLIEELVDQFH